MKKILLVDDDDSFRKMIRLTLTAMGYSVREARNGQEAMGLFEVEPPDLVLTDIVMPDKEGLETIEELRDRHPGARIIAMSGGGRVSATDYLNFAKMMGADGVLAKPFSTDEMMITLEDVLRPDAKGTSPESPPLPPGPSSSSTTALITKSCP